jgi:nucleoside-diphosphate-sugar epimerase
LRHTSYDCFLGPDTRLDMMYMPDAIRGILELMDADPARLKHRNAFNITAANFTPTELAAEIQKHLPEFRIFYDVDPVRQAIADSWPAALDDSAAREEWGWKPEYDLGAMTADMLAKLRIKLKLFAS